MFVSIMEHKKLYAQKGMDENGKEHIDCAATLSLGVSKK